MLPDPSMFLEMSIYEFETTADLSNKQTWTDSRVKIEAKAAKKIITDPTTGSFDSTYDSSFPACSLAS